MNVTNVRPMNTPPSLLSEEEIRTRVAALAVEIDDAYAEADRLVLIGVLKGSFIFLADLARKLTIPHRVEFIAVSSYGERSVSNQKIRPHRRRTVNIAWDRIHRNPIVERDARRDQRTALDACLDHQQDV